MKTCGIIAEFDPFHNGHKILIEYAKKKLGADRVIIVMSGDHVQRGIPAFTDKYSRTASALSCGADLVLEHTVFLATGSAAYFADGAVSCLEKTGVCDMLLFGSETGDIETLKQKAAASIDMAELSADPPAPNDILAIEYLKALTEKNSFIEPFTIKRDVVTHDGNKAAGNISNSSFIRTKYIENRSFSGLERYMPGSSLDHMTKYLDTHSPMTMLSYSDIMKYALMLGYEKGYSVYFDIYDDLSDKIKKNLPGYENISSFAVRLKSRDITYTHICRALLHILLDIKKDDVRKLIKDHGSCAYLKPLGFRRSSDVLLKAIKEKASVPFIAKAADAGRILDEESMYFYKKDVFASDLYEMTASVSGCFVSDIGKALVIV